MSKECEIHEDKDDSKSKRKRKFEHIMQRIICNRREGVIEKIKERKHRRAHYLITKDNID